MLTMDTEMSPIKSKSPNEPVSPPYIPSPEERAKIAFESRRNRICEAARKRGVSLGLSDVFATDLDELEARLAAQPDRRAWKQKPR